jgi:hypothetical protein
VTWTIWAVGAGAAEPAAAVGPWDATLAPPQAPARMVTALARAASRVELDRLPNINSSSSDGGRSLVSRVDPV